MTQRYSMSETIQYDVVLYRYDAAEPLEVNHSQYFGCFADALVWLMAQDVNGSFDVAEIAARATNGQRELWHAVVAHFVVIFTGTEYGHLEVVEVQQD